MHTEELKEKDFVKTEKRYEVESFNLICDLVPKFNVSVWVETYCEKNLDNPEFYEIGRGISF